jgi:hypothetical protein
MIFVAGGFIEWPVPFQNTNGLMMRDQPIAARAMLRHAGGLLPKFHPVRTNRLRASQNAAVLVVESGAVDIR